MSLVDEIFEDAIKLHESDFHVKYFESGTPEWRKSKLLVEKVKDAGELDQLIDLDQEQHEYGTFLVKQSDGKFRLFQKHRTIEIYEQWFDTLEAAAEERYNQLLNSLGADKSK